MNYIINLTNIFTVVRAFNFQLIETSVQGTKYGMSPRTT